MILIKLLMKGYSFKALWRNCKYRRRFMTSKHRPSHRGAITATQSDTHITLHAHVYMFISRQTYVRADIYYGQCICVRAIYYRHMYTCEHIFLMLLRLTVHICIRAKIYIMAYHLLLDFTKPYSGRPPHRANIGQA